MLVNMVRNHIIGTLGHITGEVSALGYKSWTVATTQQIPVLVKVICHNV